ncbi:hypothetical protein NEOC65_001310 [Neochlamydia sp. AcF65]|nr:hypothetical protein [Neochlamydia sp. AcF65]
MLLSSFEKKALPAFSLSIDLEGRLLNKKN